MYVSKEPALSRRTFLRSGAVALALPLLDAMLPSGLSPRSRAHAAALQPKRMVLIHRPLGTYHPFLFPEKTGPGYEATRYLKLLEPNRGKFTLFSGVGHLGYPNSHHTEPAVFTGVHPDGVKRADDIHNSISLDQVVASKVGTQTRVPHLTLNWANCASLSWNEKGVPIPFERERSNVFRRLFIDGTPDEIAREVKRLETGKSILDGVRDQLKSLQRDLGAADRERMDVLTTSIREAEGFLQQDQAWCNRPKPKVDAKLSEFQHADHWVAAQMQWYNLIHLALQTDSTRVIVIGLGEHSQQNQPDLLIGHHDASHHGKEPGKIEQLALYEEKEYRNFNAFLEKLSSAKEEDRTLLDNTQVLFSSNLGDASAHSSDNLPVILAGGGYKHQGHVGFDRKKNAPLSNLFVRMLQQMGIESEKFGSSTGVMSEV
ncbi:MAG TPA: DUF1552 domain-containing protein [Planctomycetota bacterium]|nr:DUF1552 domain-containing protein [Planctomycetota bacterium]